MMGSYWRRTPFADPVQLTVDGRKREPKETPMQNKHTPQQPDKSPMAHRPEPAKPEPIQTSKFGPLVIGTTVHYTHPDPRKDVVDDEERNARRAAGALPLVSNQPRVFPATVIRVNDAETGDVSIRVWHISSSNDELIANCKPSNEQAGSTQARGYWTPMDRPMYEWTDEDRARAQELQLHPSGVDAERGR